MLKWKSHKEYWTTKVSGFSRDLLLERISFAKDFGIKSYFRLNADGVVLTYDTRDLGYAKKCAENDIKHLLAENLPAMKKKISKLIKEYNQAKKVLAAKRVLEK